MDDPRTIATDRAASVKGFDPIVMSLMVLGLVFAITAMRDVGTTEPTGPAPPALATINPNTAPWWEMMVLPDIGETTACKIVEYRDAQGRGNPIFHMPADLEAVSGIGPKTARRITPYLRFDN